MAPKKSREIPDRIARKFWSKSLIFLSFGTRHESNFICHHRCVSLKKSPMKAVQSSRTRPKYQPSKPLFERNGLTIPSDTKLLLTKNYSKIIIFGKLRISRVIPWKCLYFLDISRGQNASKITKNNSQGIIFVIISCQRVLRFKQVRCIS